MCYERLVCLGCSVGVGGTQNFQAEGYEFDSRLPLTFHTVQI